MKLSINLAQKNYKKKPASYAAYLPLMLLFAVSLSAGYYWYSSINMDIERYNERINRARKASDISKQTNPEPISAKERDALMKEAAFINNIIRGRTLSWSGLIARLEKESAANISLVSLSPRAGDGSVKITMTGVGKDLETITGFIDRLERSQWFEGVFLRHTTDVELGGARFVDFSMELEYTGT